MNIDMDKVAQLEREIRLGHRGDGTMGPALDETFEVMRWLVAKVEDLRFESVAYLNRAVRAEAASQELEIVQDLYSRAKNDLDGVRSSAEIFRKSWLDCRDRLEIAQSEIASLKGVRK